MSEGGTCLVEVCYSQLEVGNGVKLAELGTVGHRMEEGSLRKVPSQPGLSEVGSAASFRTGSCEPVEDDP